MGKFKFHNLMLKDAVLIDSFKASDNRGEFVKDYSIEEFKRSGRIKFNCKETMVTFSKKGVIRGLHFQEGKEQAKLITCLQGKIYDVIVDMRPKSPTFGLWEGFILTHENNRTLYVPKGFAHGYMVLEDSIVSYKCDDVFYAEGDSGIKYDDSELGIEWMYEEIGGKDNVILSDKDASLQSFYAYKLKKGLTVRIEGKE